MTAGQVFISHRAEYQKQARALKKIIDNNAQGRTTNVFISEEIAHGSAWRQAIEGCLKNTEVLFLIYGAPYEDWSWCFYEAGFYAGQKECSQITKFLYCIKRSEVPPPSPLSHLQMVENVDQLYTCIENLYNTNRIEYDASKLRKDLASISAQLFGQLSDYAPIPRLSLTIKNEQIEALSSIPTESQFFGDAYLVRELFGSLKPAITWGEILQLINYSDDDGGSLFLSKWIEETSKIILAAHAGRFLAPQTIFFARTGAKRYRFLLYQARLQADNTYCCEFLVIDDVGGPTINLPRDLLALVTSIRMGLRFRYELIEDFSDTDLESLTAREKRETVEKIRRRIFDLMLEADARGLVTLADLLQSFDNDFERSRIRQLINKWPAIQASLFRSLGLNANGEYSSKKLQCDSCAFHKSMEAIKLLNAEFLSRCCARVSQRMLRNDEELASKGLKLDELVKELQLINHEEINDGDTEANLLPLIAATTEIALGLHQ
jgi:hypothetical protein